MTLGVADIDRWDPATVRDVAAAADSRAEAAAETALALVTLPALALWDGLAAAAAHASTAEIRTVLDAHAAEARAVARAATRAAEAIDAVKADLRRLDDDAHRCHLAIDRDSGTLVPEPGGSGGAQAFGAEGELLGARLTAIVERANSIDAELAQAITLAEQWAPPPSPTAPAGAPASLPADAIARWWASLIDSERASLIANDPERYGNYDGVPIADRDAANRLAMSNDLRRVTDVAAEHRVAVAEVIADPLRYGLSRAQVTRYGNAVRVQEGLTQNAERTGAETLLWIYRPDAFGGQGRAAVAIGNPDTADDTAVVVPGTSTSVAGGWLIDPDAAQLHQELARIEPDSAHSVIAWMGFDAPDTIVDPRVTQPELARQGGAALAADVNALSATHVGDDHLTVIGHSYGSTTVADAAAGSGMRADDIVLVGSPGTDLARTAADFRLPDEGRVYVGSASTDPVTTIAGVNGTMPVTGQPLMEVGLGPDPAADGFGSTRFKAEVPGWTWKLWTEHTGYFESGSESLYSIADITSGNGELLQDHGMTAPHRDSLLGSLSTALGLPSWSIPLADPELGRPATSGHHHQPIPRSGP
ncbi:MAG: alpha/beta fold hydrolase [Mycobacterium sp.]|nr:alpha/beta fold hydrolase [Mycobacterium sp.]